MRQRRILLLAALMVFLALFASGCRQWAAFNKGFDTGFVNGPLMRTALEPSFGVPDLVSADHRSENLGSGLTQDSVSTGGGGLTRETGISTAGSTSDTRAWRGGTGSGPRRSAWAMTPRTT